MARGTGDKGKKENGKEKTKFEGPELPGFFAGLSFSGGTNTFATNFDETNLGYEELIKGNSGVYSISGLKQTKSKELFWKKIERLVKRLTIHPLLHLWEIG